METIKDLEALLLHYIQYLYAAEKQIAEAIPGIIDKVQHLSLKNALQHHLSISKKHISRLNKIHLLLHENKEVPKPATSLRGGGANKGVAGLIAEANELLNQQIEKEVNDAAIIGCVQKIEHYEICAYGTALAYATQLHLTKAAELLRETLDEEYDADDLLTALAMAALNKEGIPEGWEQSKEQAAKEIDTLLESDSHTVSITERSIHSPGGRAGTSHRRYPSGESRGH